MTEIYRHFDRDGRLLYVGISKSSIRRLLEHCDAEWFCEIATITIERMPNLSAALRAERKAILLERPTFNRIGAGVHNFKSACAVPALRVYRQEKGLSSDDAAKKVGRTGQAWRHWESGHRRIKADVAVLIEKRLGIDRALIRPDLFCEKAA